MYVPGNIIVYISFKTAKVTECNTKPRKISFKHKFYFDIKPTAVSVQWNQSDVLFIQFVKN
jgi:hypothetical protein